MGIAWKMFWHIEIEVMDQTKKESVRLELPRNELCYVNRVAEGATVRYGGGIVRAAAVRAG